MLTIEQNEELTQVGPGTPMGELLRRYWYPIAFEQDFDRKPSKTVRLLSEDWTLYRCLRVSTASSVSTAHTVVPR